MKCATYEGQIKKAKVTVTWPCSPGSHNQNTEDRTAPTAAELHSSPLELGRARFVLVHSQTSSGCDDKHGGGGGFTLLSFSKG